jgi:hypothetical protein
VGSGPPGLESSNDHSELARRVTASIKELPEFIFGYPAQIAKAAVASADQGFYDYWP